MGYAPHECPPPTLEDACESIASGASVQSPQVGPPMPGWFLIQAEIEPGALPVHCPGGCGGL
jgi:hypothetical protein